MSLLDYDALDALAARRKTEFSRGLPYPHIVIDDFLPASLAEAVLEEFHRSDRDWSHHHHINSRKEAISSLDGMGPQTRALVEEMLEGPFVRFIERLTSIQPLLSDPDLDGGGLHVSRSGGFLNIHTDFLSHPKNRHWSRQINLLLFFNRGWQTDWNGEFEMWDEGISRCELAVPPLFNRCVLFHTTERSYHGHPTPLACPPDTERKSIALYYYRDEGHRVALASTGYFALPGDSRRKRALIALERRLLRGYHFLKRHSPLTDEQVEWILRRIFP